MKKIGLLLVLLLAFGMVIFAQSRPSVTIVNNTGYEIYIIAISPSSSSEWGDDILGDEKTLRNGQSFTYQLPQPLNIENEYDILCIDEDEDIYTKMNVVIKNNDRIVFTIDDLDESFW